MTDEQWQKHDRIASASEIALIISFCSRLLTFGVVIALWVSLKLPVWVMTIAYSLIVLSTICKLFGCVGYKQLFTYYSRPIPSDTLRRVNFTIIWTLVSAVVLSTVLHLAKDSSGVSFILFVAFIAAFAFSYNKFAK